MRRRVARSAPLLGGLIVLVLSGCSAAPMADSDAELTAVPEPTLASVPVVDTAAEIILPLDSYRLTWDETAQIAGAQARIQSECMSRFGLEYDPPLDYVLANGDMEVISGTIDNRYALRYGGFDIDQARAYGYAWPILKPAPSAWEPDIDFDDPYVRTVSHGLERPPALTKREGDISQLDVPSTSTGTVSRPIDSSGEPLPLGGCWGEALSLLSGEGGTYSQSLTDALASEPYERAANDSRVLMATAEWSACMAEQGFDYESPDAAGSDDEWVDAPFEQRPFAREIEVAVADVECKQQTGYVSTFLAVETAYQNIVIEERFLDLQANLDAGREQLRRASEYLDRATPPDE